MRSAALNILSRYRGRDFTGSHTLLACVSKQWRANVRCLMSWISSLNSDSETRRRALSCRSCVDTGRNATSLKESISVSFSLSNKRSPLYLSGRGETMKILPESERSISCVLTYPPSSKPLSTSRQNLMSFDDLICTSA